MYDLKALHEFLRQSSKHRVKRYICKHYTVPPLSGSLCLTPQKLYLLAADPLLPMPHAMAAAFCSLLLCAWPLFSSLVHANFRRSLLLSPTSQMYILPPRSFTLCFTESHCPKLLLLFRMSILTNKLSYPHIVCYNK